MIKYIPDWSNMIVRLFGLLGYCSFDDIITMRKVCKSWQNAELMSKLSIGCNLKELLNLASSIYTKKVKKLCYNTFRCNHNVFEKIAQFTNLEYLHLSSCKVNDFEIQFLTNKINLSQFTVRFYDTLTDVGFYHLCTMTNLYHIVLEECPLVTDIGLQHLSILKINQLKVLSISNKNISDVGLHHLAKLNNLEMLSLPRCVRITDIGVHHLSEIKTLKMLNISYCENVTNLSLQHLSKLHNLQEFHINNCSQITDLGLEYLSKINTLQVIGIVNCIYVTTIGIKYLSIIKTLKKIYACNCKYIKFTAARNFSDQIEIIG
jgi:hypothetical protein